MRRLLGCGLLLITACATSPESVPRSANRGASPAFQPEAYRVDTSAPSAVISLLGSRPMHSVLG